MLSELGQMGRVTKIAQTHDIRHLQELAQLNRIIIGVHQTFSVWQKETEKKGAPSAKLEESTDYFPAFISSGSPLRLFIMTCKGEEYMDTVFYDSGGRPVAYSEDNETIYLYSGEAVAYFDNTSVFAFSGQHLGRFKDGWMTDHYGYCVFFTDDAHGDPPHPPKKPVPKKALKHIKPRQEPQERKTVPSSKSRRWSKLSGAQFFDLQGSRL